MKHLTHDLTQAIIVTITLVVVVALDLLYAES